MEQTQNSGTRHPDFKGDGVAVWVNEKDGRQHLYIKVVGHNPIYAFRNDPQPKQVVPEQTTPQPIAVRV